MNDYIKVLKAIELQPKAFQGNHFRRHAPLYAEAASRGHISCLIDGINTNLWRISLSGKSFLICNA